MARSSSQSCKIKPGSDHHDNIMLMQTSQLNIQVLSMTLSMMKCVLECEPTFLACDNDDPLLRLFSLAVYILKGISWLLNVQFT